jgi:hypothetical protein
VELETALTKLKEDKNSATKYVTRLTDTPGLGAGNSYVSRAVCVELRPVAAAVRAYKTGFQCPAS